MIQDLEESLEDPYACSYTLAGDNALTAPTTPGLSPTPDIFNFGEDIHQEFYFNIDSNSLSALEFFPESLESNQDIEESFHFEEGAVGNLEELKDASLPIEEDGHVGDKTESPADFFAKFFGLPMTDEEFELSMGIHRGVTP